MSGPTFTGGDTLTPGTMEYFTHRAMMRNELANGEGAYQISNAQKAASGPSFGPFQYDVGANQHGRDLLESIATSAKDGQGHRYLSDAELKSVKDHLYKPFAQYSAADKAVYDNLKPKLDAMLASKEGIQQINDDYLPKVDAKVKAMNAIVDGVGNPANREFLKNSPVGQLIVLDTANQYGPAVNNGLKEFIDHTSADKAMKMPGRSDGATIGVQGDLGLEDLIRYKLETQYGQKDDGARDVLRRISNIVDAVGVDEVKKNLSQEDKTFLETGLKTYLEDHHHNPAILNDPQLKGLAKLGGWEHVQGNAHSAGGHSAVLKEGSEGKDVARLQRNLAGLGYTDVDGNPIIANGRFDAHTGQALERLQMAHGMQPVDGKAGSKSLEQIKADVVAVQNDLRKLDYEHNGKPLVPDGDYGQATQAAIKAFQKDHQLNQTGVADPSTLHAMKTAIQEKEHPTREPANLSGRIDQPGHVGYDIYTQARERVYELDRQLGRTPDGRSDNLAAAVAVSAHADGLKRIDQVALSTDGNTLWAVERPNGRTDQLFDQRTHVPTATANVPLEQTSAQWAQADQRQQQAQAAQQSQAQQQDQQQQQAMPVGR